MHVFGFLMIWGIMNMEKGYGEAEDALRTQTMASTSRPPQWFPGGDNIAFSYAGRVYVIDSAGSLLQLVHGRDMRGPYDVVDLAYAPNVSPNGSRIAYAAKRESGWLWWRTDSWEIMTVKPDGSDKQQLTKNNRLEVNPVWTSDGTRIAFMYLYQSGRGGVYEEAGIHDMAMDGSDLRQVVKFVDLDPSATSGIGLSRYGSPLPTLSLSPDGSRLAFVVEESRARFSQQVLFVVGVNGSGATRLAEETGPPAWSPDGHRIAYIYWKTYSPSEELVGLFTINADGTDPREIIKVPSKDFRSNTPISWSPDGSTILLGGYVIETDGSSMVRVSGLDSHSSWSPDGSRIAVHDSYSPNVVLYTVAPDGSDGRILVEKAADGSLVAANGRPLR